jgi:hypothetical protein
MRWPLDSKDMSVGRIVLAITLLVLCNPALARDQWSINHGGNNPPVDPRLLPGGSMSGYVPAVGGDFWKGQLANRVPAGTVLTVILEHDLNSGKNKPGDTFALTLDDGFSMNGKVLIPPKSKILGSVMDVQSARTLRGGRPGNMEVTLQTLVMPDGSHYPIFGFIDGNPNAKAKKPPKVRNLGVNIADYGQSVAGMAMSFVSGPGYMMKKINNKGDAIPIRLTRSLDIKPPQNNLIAQPPAGLPSQAASAPGLIDPNGPVRIPGLLPVGVAAPSAVPYTSGGAPYPPSAATMGGDPNSVFSQPVAPHHLNEMPDPF